MLRLSAECAEVAGDDILHVRLAITIGVFAEIKIWRHGDQGSAIHGQDGTRHDEVVEKRRRLVHAAIAIRVFEQ